MGTFLGKLITLGLAAFFFPGSIAVALADVAVEWEITLNMDADTMKAHVILVQSDRQVTGI